MARVLISSNSFGRHLSHPYIAVIARIGLVLRRERQRDSCAPASWHREAAVAPSGFGNIPVRFTIVPQEDGTFGVQASDGQSTEFLTSFNTLAQAEAWIAKVEGSAQ